MNKIPKTIQTHKDKNENISKSSKRLSEDTTKNYKQRIFAWLELIEIKNITANEKGTYLQLTHSRAEFFNTAKEPEHMLNKLLVGEEKCVYAIIIEQDDMEAINYFAAEQICVSVKRHAALKQSVEENSYDTEHEEQSEFVYEIEPEHTTEIKPYNYIAKGYIDILQLFSDECISIQMVVFLYSPKWATGRGAVKTTWRIYTQTPLMKNLRITNLAFISLESLFNLNEELLDMVDDICVDILFEAKFQSDDVVFDEFKICTFSVFRKNIIKSQSIYFCWENLRTNHRCSPDIRIGCTNKPQNFLKNLFCTENRDFNFHEINIFREYALTSNSTVRFVLTDELTEKLEQIIANDEQCLILKVYNIKEPGKILLQGALEPHIFLYPNVRACRFAVALDDPVLSANINNDQKTTFITINISFHSPITESRTGRSIITTILDNIAPANEDIHVCNSLLADYRSLYHKREDAYRKFDQEIKSIAMSILKNNITDYNDSGSSYVCCELKILSWKITDLIAYDFNVRVPTESSIEFANLMTLVYQELTQRVYNILKLLDKNAILIDQGTIKEDTKLQRRISYIKLLKESGDKKLADFLLKKFSRMYADCSTWHFFHFLYDIENLNFESALEYAKKPVGEVYQHTIFYIELAEIYLNYMKVRRNEKTFNEALSYLIKILNEFTTKYPRELEPWVLLHCIYKQCAYLPGVEFTRLKYENLVSKHYWDFPNIPYSRFSIYNDVYVQFYTKKAQLLFIIVKHLLWLGTYLFAEIVFDAISDECTHAEKYMFKSTIKILTEDLLVGYTMHSFDNDKSMQTLVAFTNGNIEYYRGEIRKALIYYRRILDSKDNSNQCLKLGLLRYANFRCKEHNFLDAIKAYEKYLFFGTGAFVAYYGLGKAMYQLNRLSEAEGHFANATNYPLHIPDIWAYLALINLRLGKTENALKLWKYANLNANSTISEEVRKELEALDHKMLNLFI